MYNMLRGVGTMTLIRDKKLKKYCLERDSEKFLLSTDYAVNLSSQLESYCLNNQEAGFESFFAFGKKINDMYGGRTVVEYINRETHFKSDIYFGIVEEFCLDINSSTEVVSLNYKDGKLVETYKEVKSITEEQLSDESKTTVSNMKKLIRSYPNKK